MTESPIKEGEVCMVLGSQWGDEGKGKLIDVLAEHADVVARCAGGNNAGHTVKVGDQTHFYHLLPSGIAHEHCKSILGNGVVINVPALIAEAEGNIPRGLRDWESRLLISDRAHMVFSFHQEIDGLQEIEKSKTGKSIGTTRRGIGPAYSAKMSRIGLRICDLMGPFEAFESKYLSLYHEYRKRWPDLQIDTAAELEQYRGFRERLRPMVIDTILYLNRRKTGSRILVEGANAHMLDVDFGTYPYVTSSSSAVGGACTGLGIPPRDIVKVFGVVKAYTSRVGSGPFPTELFDHDGSALQEIGREFGVTTGRRRRCGWLDLVVVQYAAIVNGLTSIMITKLDVLDTFKTIKLGVAYELDGVRLDSMPASLDDLERVSVVYETFLGWETDISGCTTYDALPENAKVYLRRIEQVLGLPIQFIGVGPERSATIRVF